jgi:anti-sigma regulatory factor (Ser/Thr protein kinase)
MKSLRKRRSGLYEFLFFAGRPTRRQRRRYRQHGQVRGRTFVTELPDLHGGGWIVRPIASQRLPRTIVAGDERWPAMTTFAVQLASTAQAPYEARMLIRERLAKSVPATTLWDVLTVVTELVTNAVRHGRGGNVRIGLSAAASGKVSGEVENDGPGRVELRPIETISTSGMGLHIVDAIADRWRVFVGSSTRVRFELPRP